MTADHPLLPDEPGAAKPPRTLVVTLTSGDNARFVDIAEFGRMIADNIARHEATGWRLVSSSVVALRQQGTTANVLFQSGGQFATMLGAVIVYQQPT